MPCCIWANYDGIEVDKLLDMWYKKKNSHTIFTKDLTCVLAWIYKLKWSVDSLMYQDLGPKGKEASTEDMKIDNLG